MTAAGAAGALLLASVRAWAQTPGSVYVEVNADDPRVRIDVIDESGTSRPVCLAPCRQMLDRRLIYVIEGDGISPTSRFVLPDDQSSVTLKVRAGTHVARAVGVTLLALGYGAEIVGYVAIGDPGLRNSPPPRWVAPVELAGLVAMIGGGLAVLLNGQTRVSSSSGRTFSAAPERRHKPPAFALTPRGLEF
jgi:hypothetical protein